MLTKAVNKHSYSISDEGTLNGEAETRLPAGNFRNIPQEDAELKRLKERTFSHVDIFGRKKDAEQKDFIEKDDLSMLATPCGNTSSPQDASAPQELPCEGTSSPAAKSSAWHHDYSLAGNNSELHYPLNKMVQYENNHNVMEVQAETASAIEAKSCKKDEAEEQEDLGEIARIRRILQGKSQIFGDNSESVSSAYQKVFDGLKNKPSREKAESKHPMDSELFGRCSHKWNYKNKRSTEPSNTSSYGHELKEELSQSKCVNDASNDSEKETPPLPSYPKLSTAHESVVSTPEINSKLVLTRDATGTYSEKPVEEHKVEVANNEKPQGAKEVLQAHLQSSLLGDKFYEKAKSINASETIKLSLTGLDANISEKDLQNFIRKCGCHVVQLRLDMDPLTHLCKGRAELVIRTSEGVEGIRRCGELLASNWIGTEIVEN